MKKIYNAPIVEIIGFSAEDIITTSNTTIGFDEDGQPIDDNGNPIQN